MQIKNKISIRVLIVSLISMTFLVGTIFNSDSQSTPILILESRDYFEQNLEVDDNKLDIKLNSILSDFEIESSSITTMDTTELDMKGTFGWDQEIIIEPSASINDLRVILDLDNNTHIFLSQYISGDWRLYHRIHFAGNDSWSNRKLIGYTAISTGGVLDAQLDSEGTIHLVYDQYGFIRYKKYSNDKWSGSTILSSGYNPKLDLDPNDRIYVAYAKAGNYYQEEFYVSIYDPLTETWETEFAFSRGFGVDATAFNLAAVPNNGEYVPLFFYYGIYDYSNYWDPPDYRIRFFALIKENNSSPYFEVEYYDETPLYDKVYNLPAPAFAKEGNGRLNIFFNCPYNNEFLETVEFKLVFQQRSPSGYWGGRSQLSTNVNQRCEFAASVDKTGKKVVVWNYVTEDPMKADLRIKTYRPNVGSWTSEQLIKPNDNFTQYPGLEFDDDGNLHLLYREDRIDGKPLIYRKGWTDTDYDGLVNVLETNGFYYPSSPFADGEGYIYTDPYNPDCDDDQMLDGEEIDLGFDPLVWDEDGDLMADGYEVHNYLDPYTNDSYLDLDNDNLTNIEEYYLDTYAYKNDSDDDLVYDWYEVVIYESDPMNPDSDGDLLTDGLEINDLHSNPNSQDSDNDTMDDYYEWYYSLKINVNDTMEDPDLDGLLNIYEYQWDISPQDPDFDDDLLDDYNETMVYHTNPKVRDTDGDGLRDGREVYETFTNPTLRDTDGDKLSDWYETYSDTDATDFDTDDDLMSDGYEVIFGLQPLNASDVHEDPDGDGLDNLVEYGFWTDPFSIDTDGDKISDPKELEIGSDPTNVDTDGEGLDDYTEIFILKTDFNDTDTDDDGLNDAEEFYIYKSNPKKVDTDGDTLADGTEVHVYKTSPILTDTDEEGLDDNLELDFNSDPTNMDTDGDGMDDYFEWLYSLDPNANDSKMDPDDDDVINIEEYRHKSNPLVTDTDLDGLSDYEEIMIYFTFAYSNDTDLDLLNDYDEILVYSTSPHDPDSDDDGVLDGQEVILGLDPTNADTDGDNVTDGIEVKDGTDPLDPSSNRYAIRTRILLITFGSITSAILIYYLAPSLIAKVSRNEEVKWIRQGIIWRRNKSNSILETSIVTSELSEENQSEEEKSNS